MKLKNIMLVALLCIVVAISIGLVINEGSGKLIQNAHAEAAVSQVGQNHKKTDNKVVAYYFHGNIRCKTCRSIEASTKEAIELAFGDALKDGRIEWKVINIDLADNNHYIKEFQLSASSVVIQRQVAGKAGEWKNLQRVWELIHGDKANFMKYIQTEIKPYLEDHNK